MAAESPISIMANINMKQNNYSPGINNIEHRICLV